MRCTWLGAEKKCHFEMSKILELIYVYKCKPVLANIHMQST